MKTVNRLTAFSALFVVSVLVYLTMAYLLRANGYYHYESLFFTEKVLVLSDQVHPKFNLMGFSYPTLQFVVCAFLFWFKPIWIPVLASSAGISLLLCMVLHYQWRHQFPMLMKVATLLFFWINPVLVYLAVSGSSVYLSLILFYVFVLSLFQYLDDLTTYRLATAALCLPLILFANYRLMWCILFLLPFIVMVSLHSLGIKNQTLYQQVETALNNRSLRRKFIGKSYSILIILLFLPACSIFFFLLINNLYTSNPYFFLENPNSTWNSLDVLRFFEFGSDRMFNFFSIDTLFVLWRSLLFCPLFFVLLFWQGKQFYRMLIAGGVIALLLFLHQTYGFFTITSEYLVLYLSFALVMLLYAVKESRQMKGASVAACVLLGLCVISGYFYMQHSSYKPEHLFIDAWKQPVNQTELEESKAVAAYLSEHVPANKRILIDDAVLYPVVAFSGRTDFLILHYHRDFLAILQDAEKYCDYIVLPDEYSELGSLDIINQYHKGMYSVGRDYLKLVFKTKGYRVYQVRFYSKHIQMKGEVESSKSTGTFVVTGE